MFTYDVIAEKISMLLFLLVNKSYIYIYEPIFSQITQHHLGTNKTWPRKG